MKLLLIITLLLTTSCGKWYANWQGEVKKIELQKAGEALLLEAESSRKIQIEDARGKLESAKLLSEAEVARARGVAEANNIIGESLKNNEAYLRYLWINNMSNTGKEVIYVPTEASIPILEAGKRK